MAQVATALAAASGSSRCYSATAVNLTVTGVLILLVSGQVLVAPLVQPDPACVP